MASSSSASGGLHLPLTSQADDPQYAAIPAGSTSPASGGSPTAREVRLECKEDLEATRCLLPVWEKDGGPEPVAQVVEHPLRQRIWLVVGVAFALATVAAGTFVATTLKPAGHRFALISKGSCESNDLHRVLNATQCAEAAQELGLSDLNVKEVPVDAVAGLNQELIDTMPQDCYFLTTTNSDGQHASLWYNPHMPGSRATVASKGPVTRQPICVVPPHPAATASGHSEPVLRGKAPPDEPQDDPWALARELPLPDSVMGLMFGTTTTTTATTTSTTHTITTSTTSTTTWTGSTTTTTSTSRTHTTSTSTETTSTSTTVTTSTSTFTTTYHTVPTLFCYSVVRTQSYELNNMRTALAKKVSIFACNDQMLFTDVPYELQPGVPVPGWGDLQWVDGIAPVQSVVLNIGLETHPKPGSLEGILNTEIFMQAWRQVNEDGRFRMHDWTVKVDPDAVFFPQRLVADLKAIAPASTSPNMYVVNCKISFGLFGAVEVFSRVALETYVAGEEKCKQSLDWTMMGEDLYMKRCMDFLGVQQADDYHMLSDGYCSEQASPCYSGKVAFHPFKSALSYLQCYTEAMMPTTTTVTTKTHTTSTRTTSTRTTTKKHEHTEGSHGHNSYEDEEAAQGRAELSRG